MLIVIESPNKSKKIRELTKANVVATVGHFKDLPEKSIAVDLETFEAEFAYNTRGKKVAAQLRAAAKGEEVFIATDPDREGYAIGYFAQEEMKPLAKSIKRLEIREITKKGIDEAFAHAIPFDQTNKGLFNSFLGRRVGDRVVGYVLSPRASRYLHGAFSVGRVQSPAVRLLVEREREIRAFVPEPFWKLTALLTKDETPFLAIHQTEKFKDQAAADAALAAVQAAKQARTESVETKETRQHPKAPFTTVDLQATANAQLGMAPEWTMKMAQGLFEAGLITYHRTDSVRLADEFVTEIRAFVTGQFGANYLPAAPNVFKAKNSQADAHEGIRPTHVAPPGQLMKEIADEKLTADHQKVYELIYKRALASQMADSVFDSTTAKFTLGGEPFKANGRVMKFDGYEAIYRDEEEDETGAEAEPKDDRDQKLPALAAGDAVDKLKETLEAKQTKPPARFTEGRLVKELEKRGIGRPSTYASIIRTLKTREYVVRDKGKLVPTFKAEKLFNYLNENHPWLIDYDMTRKMEEYLDQVEEQGKDWKEFVRDLHNRIGAQIEKVNTELAKREPGTPSEKQLAFAASLAEQTKLPLTDEDRATSKAISKWIDAALKIARAVAPLSFKQQAVVDKHADEETRKKIAAGDYAAGRDWLEKFFKELKQRRFGKRKGAAAGAESAPASVPAKVKKTRAKAAAPAAKKAPARKKAAKAK